MSKDKITFNKSLLRLNTLMRKAEYLALLDADVYILVRRRGKLYEYSSCVSETWPLTRAQVVGLQVSGVLVMTKVLGSKLSSAKDHTPEIVSASRAVDVLEHCGGFNVGTRSYSRVKVMNLSLVILFQKFRLLIVSILTVVEHQCSVRSNAPRPRDSATARDC
jgi:hypothetical protein